jgi:hypothetical protein
MSAASRISHLVPLLNSARGGLGVGHLDIGDLGGLVEVEVVDGQGHLGLDEGRAATTRNSVGNILRSCRCSKTVRKLLSGWALERCVGIENLPVNRAYHSSKERRQRAMCPLCG